MQNGWTASLQPHGLSSLLPVNPGKIYSCLLLDFISRMNNESKKDVFDKVRSTGTGIYYLLYMPCLQHMCLKASLSICRCSWKQDRQDGSDNYHVTYRHIQWKYS